MTSATPHRTQPSPNAERLRAALGWSQLPEMTKEQHEAFEAEENRIDQEVHRFYRDAAA